MLTIDAIKHEVEPLARKYNVVSVDLFGSYAVGKATETSDADFLVKFGVPVPSIFAVMGLKEELAMALNTAVDIVTLPLVKPEMINIREVKNIYERT